MALSRLTQVTGTAPLAGQSPATSAPAGPPTAGGGLSGDQVDVQGGLVDFPPAGLLDAKTRAQIAQGFLPPDFLLPGRYEEAARESMRAGADRLASQPRLQRWQKHLRPGDVVMVESPDPVITGITGSPWTHAAIVTSVHPPTLVEAIGMTGDHAGQVRQVPASEFLGCNRADATYKVIRPCPDPSDPAQAKQVQAAVAFAQAQIGKPYDFAFQGNRPGNDEWYCSSLAYACYDANPMSGAKPLVIDEAGRAKRDGKVAAIKALADALGVSDAQMPAVAELVKMTAAGASVPQRVDYVVNTLLPTLPSSSVLYDVYRAPGGPEALRRLLTDGLEGNIQIPDLPRQATNAQDDLRGARDQAGQALGSLGNFFADPLGALSAAGGHVGQALGDAGQAKDTGGATVDGLTKALSPELAPLGANGWQVILAHPDKWARLIPALQEVMGDAHDGKVDPTMVSPGDIAEADDPNTWTFAPDPGPAGKSA